jgi:hypothetical protein
MWTYLIVFLFTFITFSTIAYLEFFYASQFNLKIFPRTTTSFLDLISVSFIIGFFWPIVLVAWFYLTVTRAFTEKD